MKSLLKIIKILFVIMIPIYLIFVAFFASYLIDNVKCVFILESITIILLVPFLLLSYIKPDRQNIGFWIFKIVVVVLVTVTNYKTVLNTTKDLIILLNSKPEVIVGTVEDNFEKTDNTRFLYLDTDRYTHYIASKKDDFIIGKEYTLYYLPNTKTVISYEIN